MSKSQKVYSKEEKFRWFVLLEQNNMNQAKTADQLNINRSTLQRSIKKYWDEYTTKKVDVKKETTQLAAQRLIIDGELDKFRGEIAVPFRKIINEMCTRLDDADHLKRIPFKLLIEAFKEMAPYVAEKQGILGIPDPNSPEGRHTSVVNNIIQNMQIVNNEKQNN